jgi:hypothetical protein
VFYIKQFFGNLFYFIFRFIYFYCYIKEFNYIIQLSLLTCNSFLLFCFIKIMNLIHTSMYYFLHIFIRNSIIYYYLQELRDEGRDPRRAAFEMAGCLLRHRRPECMSFALGYISIFDVYSSHMHVNTCNWVKETKSLHSATYDGYM